MLKNLPVQSKTEMDISLSATKTFQKQMKNVVNVETYASWTIDNKKQLHQDQFCLHWTRPSNKCHHDILSDIIQQGWSVLCHKSYHWHYINETKYVLFSCEYIRVVFFTCTASQ